MSVLELTPENASQLLDSVAGLLPREPPRRAFRGRGIVICAGGIKYLTCAWVCINVLRELGCRLPIELWHLGLAEMPDGFRRMVEPLGVRCVDALEVARQHPARILRGWEIKPYAIIHSSFREVLLLDSDNVPVRDPTFLFDTPQYRKCGATFWPDFNRLPPGNPVWGVAGLKYRDEPEVESGQIVVDKARCWQPLGLTMWMNEYSDFWYRYIYGDKETFHLAWRKLDRPFASPQHPIHALPGVMCQHDFSGGRLFQHRNLCKWTLRENPRVPGFELEPLCLRLLDELRAKQRIAFDVPPFDPLLSQPLSGVRVEYHRIGHDKRPVTFEPNGTIGSGGNWMELYWGVIRREAGVALQIHGNDGLTAELVPDSKDSRTWRGQWVIHERMPVEITAVGIEPSLWTSRATEGD